MKVRNGNNSAKKLGNQSSGNMSVVNPVAHRTINRRRRRSSLKRTTVLRSMNLSMGFQDSPSANGMYKRRRRMRRSRQRQRSSNSMQSSDDVIIIPNKPPEVISLLDSDDEVENNDQTSTLNEKKTSAKKMRQRSRNRYFDSPSSSRGPSKRFASNDAFVPFFIDNKKEETPVLQIPMYNFLKKDISIICLDDSVASEKLSQEASSGPVKVKQYSSLLDESVLVVEDGPGDVKGAKSNTVISIDDTLEEGEIRDTMEEDFIPINSKPTPKTTAQKEPSPKLIKEKRLIVVDGNNIAMAHGNKKLFSMQGIKIVIDHFEEMGHEVKVIVPQFRMKLNKTSSQVLIEKLHDEGKILLTPCKNLPGNMSASYDDRFILEVAEQCDGAIVSNDNYKDLLNEKPEWKQIISSRVIGFMFCGDRFLLPQDPYGKNGPKLDTILHKQPKK